MYITRYTDYSLRVLIYLAVHKNELCTIADIAQSYSISKNHLMKIVQDLNNRGYLKAIRGKNGGLKLNDKPSDINIGVLVRSIEDESKVVECFSDKDQCVISPCCQLKQVFRQAMSAFFNKLEEFTLADLVGEKEERSLAKLLMIDVKTLADKSTGLNECN